MSNMRVTITSTADVEANPQDYNSSFHTALEAPGLVVPTEDPQTVSRWLPLIARSQGIAPSAIQIITLTRSQAALLHQASASTIHTGIINRVYAEELADEIHPAFSPLVFPPEGYFLRLDACSPKDGIGGITAPLRTVAEVVLRLTSSRRARNALDAALRRGAEGVKLYFLPFRARMATKHEYRVFCAPPQGDITALSQYKWHTESELAERWEEEGESVVEEIMEGVRGVHAEIVEELGRGRDEVDVEMGALMLRQGFSFDVMWVQMERRCVLIELNGFGARSGTGACLFHWIRDMAVLYGRSGDGVEFRISLENRNK